MYRYQNNLKLEDEEIDMKLSENQELLAKRVNPSSYIDIFLKRGLVLDDTTGYIWNIFNQEWKFSF